MNKPDFRTSLLQDLKDGNEVILYLRKFPWPITGKVKSVGQTRFTLDTVTVYRISDIIHYRRV